MYYPAFPRRRRPGAGRPRVGCRGGHGEVSRSRPCRPRNAWSATRRSIPWPACSRIITASTGVYGRRKGGWFKDMFGRRLRGGEAAAPSSAGGRCSGSASGPRKTRASPSPWSNTSITSSRAARCCCRPRTWTIRSMPRKLPGVSGAAPPDRGHRRAFRRDTGSISRTPSRTGSSPISTGPTAWPPRSTDPQPAGGAGRRRAWCGCSRPEQVERKVNAIFGQPWGKLQDQLAILYGGIDSKEVTERAADPSGAMGAIQRILVQRCGLQAHRARLRPPAAERRLFPGHRARRAARLLPRGRRRDPPGHRPPARARAGSPRRGGFRGGRSARSTCSPASSPTPRERKGSTAARDLRLPAQRPDAPADPHYTIRAWRAVVTYLLRRPEFLYE